MTAAEQAEWSGNPLTASDFGYDSTVNLFSNGAVIRANDCVLKYRGDSVIVSSTVDSYNSYAYVLIGKAEDFEGKTLTLSVDEILSEGVCSPALGLYWVGESYISSAGCYLSDAGSITSTLIENLNSGEFLALFVCISNNSYNPCEKGAVIQYKRISLVEGDVKKDYVPGYAVLPTPATKGAYNYSDLNRVENAVAEISEKWGLNLETKTNWGLWDVPNQADMDRYLANVEAIRTALIGYSDFPTLPSSLNKLTFDVANTIEKILAIALEINADHICRSGELFCGEV